MVDHLVLNVHSAVLEVFILRVENFAEALLGLFGVNLGELLKFHLVLGHQMLLLLSKITEVLGGGASEDLSRGDSDSFLDDSSGRNDSEGLNVSATADGSSHTNESVVVDSASVESGISTDIAVLTDCDLVSSLLSVASNTGQVLNGTVLANGDLSSVSADDNTVPERCTFHEAHVSDDSSVRGNPVTLYYR